MRERGAVFGTIELGGEVVLLEHRLFSVNKKEQATTPKRDELAIEVEFTTTGALTSMRPMLLFESMSTRT